MKSVQLIKQVNNTELGKAGTHDTYILIPQELDVSDLFDTPDKVYPFVDKERGNTYRIRLTSAREKRIVGLGPFYRDQDVRAGDKVLLEKRSWADGAAEYFLAVRKAVDVVYFQKVKGCFEVLTPERLPLVQDTALKTAAGEPVQVIYHGEISKRADSQVMTRVYRILLDGREIAGDYQSKDIIGLRVCGGVVTVADFRPWEKFIMEVAES